MIKGIGVDTVEIRRVLKCCERSHFVERIFTTEEIRQFDRRKVRAASDFAGKEAVAKVFGTGFSGCDPCEIEIRRDSAGAPYVCLYGKAEKLAEKLGIRQIKISITNTAEAATAFAVGCSDEEDVF